MNRWQTVLAVLSVALGVAAFATVVAVDTWQRQQIRDLALEFAPDVLVIRTLSEWPADVEFVPGENFGITFSEAMSLNAQPGVAAVAYQEMGGRVLGDTVSIQRVPVSESIFEVLGLTFAAGHAFGEQARTLGLPFVVIGATVAEELFGGAEEAAGQMMPMGGGQTARVEGVLAPVASGVDEYQYLNASALVPFSATFAFNVTERPVGTTIFVRHEPGARQIAIDSLKVALDELPVGRLYEVIGSDTWLGSQQVFRSRVADELARGSGWVVLLALLATVGNLANTLALRAADRARTMAVRRALGATRSMIVAEVILDGLIIGGIGTIVGLTLWPFIHWAASINAAGIPSTFEALAIAVGGGPALSLLAAVVPTLWTLRMPIFRALREQLSPPVWEGVALTGMAAGVPGLVVASSISTGTETWFRQRLAEIGADRVVITTVGGPADRRTSALSPPPFDEVDVRAVAALPGVTGASTLVRDSLKTMTLEVGGEAVIVPVSVARVTGPFFDIYPRPIVHGRAPLAGNEVVIGPRAAEQAYPGVPLEEVIGLPLVLGRPTFVGAVPSRTYTIAGILDGSGYGSPGDLFEGSIVRLARDDDPPITAVSGRDMHIRIDMAADFAATLQSIREVVDQRHPEYGATVIHQPAGDLSQVRATMAAVGRAWSVMAWISLLVGAIGLASVVVIRLIRSRSELALKRAVGATQLRIATISTGMALRIAGYASLVGLVLAAAVTWWVTSLAPWGFFWPWLEAATALSTALLVALLAVSLPVFALSRTPPWSVLKEE